MRSSNSLLSFPGLDPGSNAEIALVPHLSGCAMTSVASTFNPSTSLHATHRRAARILLRKFAG
jgi:hypothetical protein